MPIQTTAAYRGSQPSFLLDAFFRGPLVASGIFCDRKRRVRNRFFMHMRGDWEGKRGTLEERFTFVDDQGQSSHAERIWKLEQIDATNFRGTAQGSAGDIVGIAEGAAEGYAMHWRYTVRQPVGDKAYNLRTDDRMYLLGPNHVINHSRMHFLGFFVGEAIIEIHRLPADEIEAVAGYPNPETYR
ncbi:DUF3833 family protein [Candidatus Igneacidithiobacillus taiwanensis]|uniref:DUF3833 family protein n=1 Tax=Candidatus Igneacidithiobacillus taiwanensis TaxID=1945924 RepID=UPI0028A17373|nr:DUF3833 family protein [Candidatus Igneacidithiobacillus taiwanensis]